MCLSHLVLEVGVEHLIGTIAMEAKGSVILQEVLIFDSMISNYMYLIYSLEFKQLLRF